MLEYHLYLTGPDGHILRRHNLFCDTDEAVLRKAKQYVDGHDVEVWEGTRKVAILSPASQE